MQEPKFAVEIVFQDGCKFVMAGSKYETGWHLGTNGSDIKITCPHGSIMHYGANGLFEERQKKGAK